jgi:hypothetical protein
MTETEKGLTRLAVAGPSEARKKNLGMWVRDRRELRVLGGGLRGRKLWDFFGDLEGLPGRWPDRRRGRSGQGGAARRRGSAPIAGGEAEGLSGAGDGGDMDVMVALVVSPFFDLLS